MRFTKDHEWIEPDGGLARVGLTAYAVEQLGDMVSIDLPKLGAAVKAGERLAAVQSVNGARDLHAPAAGEVVEVHAELAQFPETVEDDPEGRGWVAQLRLADPSQLDALMDRAAYEAFLGAL